MATLATTAVTLVDFAKRLDPGTNSVTTTIAELLSTTNEILDDMLWKEGNLPTGHRLTMRTGLPDVAFRKLNAGVAKSKSTTAQVDEACGMIEGVGQIDKRVASLNGSTAQFRLSENTAFLEAMNQKMATALFYGDHTVNPEQFLGLAPRYSTISGAVNGQNILDAGGTGGDNTSVWLIAWGDNSAHGLFPKASKAGLSHLAVQDGSGDGCTEATDSAGNTFRAYVDRYMWDVGFGLPDWRYIVRIANIDISDLIGATGTQALTASTLLLKLMLRAIDRIPQKKNVKLAFYGNRTVMSLLKVQGLDKSQNALSIKDGAGQLEGSYFGVPLRTCDAILNSETRIT